MKKLFPFYIVLLFSVFTFSNCELEDPELGINTSEIISLTASQLEILANGESRITLTATLEEKADPNLEITFSTEAGSFPLGGENAQEITLAASGRTATVDLQSNNFSTGVVTVSASVGNYRAAMNIDFTESLADEITVSSDRQIVTADRVDFAQITTTLFKNLGTPTIGAKVNYEVIELDTARANIIPFDFVNEDFQSVVNVKSENGKIGVVQVKISVENQEGEEVFEVVELFFEE